MRPALLLGILAFALWLVLNAWLLSHLPVMGSYAGVFFLPPLGLGGSILGGKWGAVAMVLGGVGGAFTAFSDMGLYGNPVLLYYLLPTFLFVVGGLFAFRERKSSCLKANPKV